MSNRSVSCHEPPSRKSSGGALLSSHWAILTLLELRSLYGINRFLHTCDKKVRNRYLGLSLAWVILLIIAFVYVGGLTYAFCSLSVGVIVPSYLATLAGLLILAFGLFRAGPSLFHRKSYDSLASMPLKTGAIVASRFTALYAEDLLLTLVILVPGLTVYALLERPPLVFYAMLLPASLLLPVLPLVLSALLGSIVLGISSRMKHKSLVQTFLMLALVFGVLAGSFALGTFTPGDFWTGVPGDSSAPLPDTLLPETIAPLLENAGQMLARYYPPAGWFGDILLTGSPVSLLLYGAASGAPLALLLWAVSRHFAGLSQKLLAAASIGTFQMQALTGRSLTKALFLREWRRYFASSIYVTNTIIGPIMGCLAAAAVFFTGPERLFGAPEAALIPAELLLPVLAASVMCMMPTTACSISMEGKQFWLAQSLPIPVKALFDSKLLLYLALCSPFYLLTEIFLIAAIRPGIFELLWFLLLPPAMIFFSGVLGITVNCLFHRFDWEKEEAVVKQGVSTLLGGFAGPLAGMVLAGILLLVPAAYTVAAQAGILVLFAGITLGMYRRNNRERLERM